MVTRIRQLLEHKQLTPTQFADLIGVGRPVMSHILSERNKPSLEVVQRMISAFPDVSIPWLLSGAGEMLTEAAASPPEAPAPASPVSEPPASRPAVEPLVPAPLAEASLPAPSAVPEPEAPMPVPPQSIPVAKPTLPEALPRPFTAPKQAPVAPIAAVPPVAAEPAALPVPTPLPESTPEAAPVAQQPFRAARFVPLEQRAPNPGVEAPTPSASPAHASPASVITSTSAPATTAVGLPAGVGAEADLLPFLSESRKAIRRIVIFYRDGSFADYQPE